MKNIKYTILPLCAALLASCGELNVDAPETALPEEPQADVTVLTATIGQQTKTVLGAKDAGGQYKVSWTVGDKINVNGEESAEAAVSAEGAAASFSFGKEMSAPFKAVYPSSAFKSASEDGVVTVTVPAAQTYTTGTFDPASALMYASASEGTALTFHHLMAYLKLSFSTVSDEDNIKTITVKSRGTESMSGDFTLDFTSGTVAAAAGSKAGSITVGCGEAGVALGTEVIVAVPAQTYASGLEIVTADVNGDKTAHLLKKEFVAAAGTVYPMPISFELYPGSRKKPITVHETVGGEEKDIVWAPVYCGYSTEHPNGLLYQYGRAKGQPYYPAGSNSSMVKSGPTDNPEDAYFYKKGSTNDWYSGTSLTAWPMKAGDAGYVEGKIGNPCPDGWRLPTIAEFQGLMNIGFTASTDWSFESSTSWTDAQNEASIVKGGFTLNDGSGLFFAAAGFRNSGGSSTQRSPVGTLNNNVARVWCSDRQTKTETAKATIFQYVRNANAPEFYPNVKVGGCSVRCVKEQ